MDKTVPPGAALLLDFIGNIEAPLGYETIYGNNQRKLSKPITSMTLDELEAHQPSWTKRYGSSASGRYQFMKNTLDAPQTLRDIEGEMGLTGKELFSPDLQDRMAYHLLKRRGYTTFMSGKLSIKGFALNLAKEWASLPVLDDTQGQKRHVTRGQSYYAGDGRNKSLVKPERVERILEQAKTLAALPAQTEPETPAGEPRSWVSILIDFILSLFKRR
jgi:muramidase (phage lysozyme)